MSTLAGLAIGELVAGFVRGASSPVLPVGQEVIDVVPPAVKDWAIDWFGTADKAVLILGTVVVLAGIGSLVGTLVVRGRRQTAVVVTGVVGLIGATAVLARPDPTIGRLLPTIIGTVVSVAVLLAFAPRLAPPVAASDDRADDADAGPRRRSFLRAAGAVAGVSVVAGVVGRTLAGRFRVADERSAVVLPDVEGDTPTGSADRDPSRDFGIEGVQSWVVPNDDFFRIDTALSVPQVPKDAWRLRIHGLVDREIELTFADLLELPQVERYITLTCVSNEVGGGLVGNASWQGVLLAPLLAQAGPDPGATQVVSRSVDGWTCGSPTSVIMDGRDAMLAIGMNGEPLPPEHGYPVRLVVPGLYGYVSATKWVTEIELTRWEDFDGYWIPRGWAKEAPVKTMARIDRPRSGRTYARSADGTVDIAGLAWAVHRGIGRVEVSIDGGAWAACELADVPGDDTWRQWRYRWPASPGPHDVRVRAEDADGVPQPVDPRPPAPDGAQGLHRVEFEVE